MEMIWCFLQLHQLNPNSYHIPKGKQQEALDSMWMQIKQSTSARLIKLGEKFTYLCNNISSTESDSNTYLMKAWTVSCWLVSRSFSLLFLLSQWVTWTLICLNKQLLQWKILAPFMHFELTIICISASLSVSSAVHAHSYSQVHCHIVYLACHPLCNCEKVPHIYPAHNHHMNCNWKVIDHMQVWFIW